MKRKVAEKKASERIAKKEKPAKDPNKPKRPPSAFFVFMEEFRKQFKERNPENKSVAVVGKAGGDKWKSMPDAEKAPFVAKAEKRKAEYEKILAAYNGKKNGVISAADEDGDGSDKCKSEVHNGEDAEESGEVSCSGNLSPIGSVSGSTRLSYRTGFVLLQEGNAE